MRAKQILLICLLLGTFLIVYSGNVSASSTVDESGTGVGIHILEGDYPPSPEAPSPIIHKKKIVSTRQLPKTGSVDSCWGGMIGSILLILIVYIKYSLWLRDKKKRYLMKKYKLIRFFLVLALLLIPFLLGQEVSAEENNSQVGFSVSPNYNEVQNKESSFFDLLVQPNSKQTIGITVTNTSKEDSNYTVKTIQASTNKNGVIDYTDDQSKSLGSVPFDLNKQSSYEEKIKLSAGETKQVPVILNIPDKPFKGEVLGGINVTKEVPKQDKAPQLVNQYSYVVGLRIREGTENNERELSAGKVKPVVSFGKTGITVPISNDQSNSMGKLTVESVLKRDGKEIKKETYKDREIAPNSVYPYSLSWGKKDYLPGNYQLSIVVTDAQSHKWSFNKEFNLKAEEVNEVKNAAVHPPKEDHQWIWWLTSLFIVIILGLIMYIFNNKRGRREKND